MTGHQTAIDTLRKTSESLITSEGDLLSNTDEIQETVGEGRVERREQILHCLRNTWMKKFAFEYAS